MDIKVFKTFLELAKHRHFGRTAENLHISQAAVSARIKQLESYFDNQLFTRDRGNIQLTSSGERLISYAETITNTLQQSKLELSLENGKILQIKLAAIPNVWHAYLHDYLNFITEEFNAYSFIAEFQSSEQLKRRLLDYTLDIAFSFDQIKSPDIHNQKVVDIDLVLVATDTFETTFQSKYVYVDWGVQFSEMHALLYPQMSSPCLRTTSSHVALEHILIKGGCAYLPKRKVEILINSGQLFILPNAVAWNQSIYLNYRKNNALIDAITLIGTRVQ